jgi:ABC-2 type transport system permease protein
MVGFWAVYRREMLSLWVTPLAWLLCFAFLLLQGISFYVVLDHFAHFTSLSMDLGPTQSYFSSFFIPVTLLLVCPALTMGLFAEERRSGTIEALLTAVRWCTPNTQPRCPRIACSGCPRCCTWW